MGLSPIANATLVDLELYDADVSGSGNTDRCALLGKHLSRISGGTGTVIIRSLGDRLVTFP